MEELKEIIGEYDLPSFILRCRNFEFFCNNVLKETFKEGGIKDYMLEWFSLIQNNDGVGIFAPRGFAKTTVMGVAYPLWLVLTNKNIEIMIVSQSESRSKKTLSIIKSLIENNPLLVELKPKDFKETWSSKQINLSTNCKIYCRTFTRTIKGDRNDIVLMDEAESYENPELFFDYIVPTLKKGGKIVLISTPEVNGLIQMIEDRNIGYVIGSYPAIVNGKSIWPEMFPMKRLDRIKKIQGEQFFQKNFMLNPFSESGKSIFTAESIRLASDKNSGFTSKHLGGEVYIGADFAIASGPDSDFDCFVASEIIDERVILKHGELHRGWPVPAKVQRLIELFEEHKAIMIIADESHVGFDVIRQLKAEGIPVQSQSFAHRERHRLLTNLKSILDSGRIKIPRNLDDLQCRRFIDKLEVELLSIHQKTSDTSGITSFISTGAHDDTVMALAMAVKNARQTKKIQDHWGIAK